jgi:DNA-binding MarR family transcriptional regulator
MDIQKDLGYLFHHLSFVLARQSDQVLQEQLGIGFSQFKLLLILDKGIGIQQRDIAVKLGQTEASISRQIRLMQQSGLITSEVAPNNRRRHITRVTPKGKRVTDKAMEILNNYHSPIFARLTAKQQDQMREALTLMHNAACDCPGH